MYIDEEKLLISLAEKKKIFWEPLVASGILLMAILGTMIPLYIHSENETREQIKELSGRTEKQINELSERSEKQIEAIRQDVKDFHMRLCEIQQSKK